MQKYICLMVIIIILLSGCQPTPETEIIKPKEDINTVVEEYDKSGQTTDIDENQSETMEGGLLSDVLVVPDTASFELSGGNGYLTVVANEVDIIVPEVSSMGAVTIMRSDFDEKQLQSIANIWFEGNKIYEPAPRLKSDYQEIIDNAYAYIEELKASGQETLIPSIEQEIVLRQEQMLKAPETWEMKEEDFEWEKEEGVERFNIFGENRETQWVYGITANKMESQYDLYLKRVAKEDGDVSMLTEATYLCYQYSNREIEQILKENRCEFTEDEACRMSIEFLEKIGVSTKHLYVSQIVPAIKQKSLSSMPEYENGIQGYVIYFGHGVNGVAETRNRNFIRIESETTQSAGMNEGKMPYQYEELLVTVGNYGVEAIVWHNPMEVTEILSEEVALLTYNEIEDVVKMHLGDAYARYVLEYKGYDALEDVRSEDTVLEVDRIVLGMMRVQNPNDENNYTLIPVWDVFPKGNIITYPNHEHSMLTINAMDGSIVSRENGY